MLGKELSEAITKGKWGFECAFTMRIPAEVDRDADLVLMEAARRLLGRVFPDTEAGLSQLKEHLQDKMSALDRQLSVVVNKIKEFEHGHNDD